MLQAASIAILSLMLQDASSQQPKVTEELQINCKNASAISKPAEVETADEKAARYEDDFAKALMQMDKCLKKVVVGAAGAGGGGGSAGSTGSGGGAGSAANASDALQGTDQATSTAPENNGAPSETNTDPARQSPPAPSQNSKVDTPTDIPSKASDDVVAQQLRELAENEPDPELRKKYWNQYRKYRGLKEVD